MSSFLIVTTGEHLEQASTIAENLGGYALVAVKDRLDFDLQIGRLDPDVIILFSQTLSAAVFNHSGYFSDIAYTIREVPVLGRPRRVLALPDADDCVRTHFEVALARLKELL